MQVERRKARTRMERKLGRREENVVRGRRNEQLSRPLKVGMY
jgi:hypothetical protein